MKCNECNYVREFDDFNDYDGYLQLDNHEPVCLSCNGKDIYYEEYEIDTTQFWPFSYLNRICGVEDLVSRMATGAVLHKDYGYWYLGEQYPCYVPIELVRQISST